MAGFYCLSTEGTKSGDGCVTGPGGSIQEGQSETSESISTAARREAFRVSEPSSAGLGSSRVFCPTGHLEVDKHLVGEKTRLDHSPGGLDLDDRGLQSVSRPFNYQENSFCFKISAERKVWKVEKPK